MDEDVRARRIGILRLEKTLTPALTQALFRVKESAQAYHVERIKSSGLDEKQKQTEFKSINKQIREVKWSELNLMRSYIAIEFVQTFFHYWSKGPLPALFFNAPFITGHLESINDFFSELPKLKIDILKDQQNSNSVFFLDAFTSAPGFRFEEKVRDSNNLARCFRLDSRAHDIMQLTDLLLGITVFKKFKKKTVSKAKLRVIRKFDELFLSTKKRGIKYNCIYELP